MYRKKEMIYGRWRRLHLYAVYALFGIPREAWLECVPLQTTANYEEEIQIGRFLGQRRRAL